MAGAKPVDTTGSSKPGRPVGPQISYQGGDVSLRWILNQLEKIDNIAGSEVRKIKRDGVRPCLKENEEWLDKLIFMADSIYVQLEEIKRSL